MRIKRIAPIAYAAVLIVALLVGLWFFVTTVVAPGREAPPHRADAPLSADPQPDEVPPVEAQPPAIEPPPKPTGAWHRVTGSPEFPASRVRPANPPDEPDELLLRHRLLLRQVSLETNGVQMRVSGGVITDFVADRTPPGSGLPQGQLLGLQVGVALYHYDKVVRRDSKGKLIAPRVRPKEWGRLVGRQLQMVTVADLWSTFGTAHFELPPLGKPLAPGLYSVEATLRFKQQPDKQLEALRWCSSLYGVRAETETDPSTLESKTILHDVMAEPDIHRDVHHEMVETVGNVQDSARLLVGDLLRTPDLEDNLLSGTCIETSYHQVIQGVKVYARQLDDLEEESKRNQRPGGGRRTKPNRQAFEDRRRIERQNRNLISRCGGRATAREILILQGLKERHADVLRQVADFQDRLLRSYWVVLDGWLLYAGWHSINTPGYNAWEAVRKNDNQAARNERLAKLKAARAPWGGLAARWEGRRELWKYYPDEVRSLAFAYLRTKEETDKWDADKFTRVVRGKVRLDAPAWAVHSDKFLAAYEPAIMERIATLDTARRYAVQVWPEAFLAVRSALDDIELLPASYEYYPRVEVQGEARKDVRAEWKGRPIEPDQAQIDRLARLNWPAPSMLKMVFDRDVNAAKSALSLNDFVARTQAAIDAGRMPPGR